MDRTDLFHGHIGGIDTLARGLLVAADMIEARRLDGPRRDRYSGWAKGVGASILSGEASLEGLEEKVASGEIDPSRVGAPGAARESGESANLGRPGA